MFTSRLKNEQVDRLAKALLSLRDEEECYRLLEDLMTIREVQDLAQRLEVATLLSTKGTYTEIVEKTGVSSATIGRVNRALNYGSGGYALVLERLREEEQEQ
ncbi:MAG: YerC/YecD family TrpR-related protein [Christensenellales bacterium]|nr:YerC/YecD family TrpR-related protein [Christensenellales bacterium]